jgi:mannose-6-phosphate isomerase-like protein (cupin superfamily)
MPDRSGFHATLAEVFERLPTPDGKAYAVAFERGTLTLGLYAPRGSDPQGPHTRDEVYVVMRGTGRFVNGDTRHPFGPGDILVVAAGTTHRFEEFSDDLAVWVVFYGPEGGEQGT